MDQPPIGDVFGDMIRDAYAVRTGVGPRPLAGGRMPRPVIAVARVSRHGVEAAPASLLARCRSVLLDTASDRPGGTGIPFDWDVLAGKTWSLPLILAGGLNPANVGAAITRVRPSAVDVASGTESSPGIKDEGRMKEFFAAVRLADTVAAAELSR